MSAASLPATSSMSAPEWQARCDLAALYHVANHLGWTDLVNTHISARVPDQPDTFLINRYGEMFDEITPTSLVKMDMDGNVLGDPGRFNKAGFTIHSGVLKVRPDANFVLHTHTKCGTAASLLPGGLRPISQDVLHVLDDLGYHPYGMPASQEECDALGAACQKGSCAVLLNHGLLTFGATIHGTMFRMYKLDRACETEMLAYSMGIEPVRIAENVVEAFAAMMKKRRASDAYGLMEWEGLLRTIDRRRHS